MPEVCHILSDSKCEIAIFNESWLTPSVPDQMIKLSGYNIVRQDTDTTLNKSRGGALLIYYKNCLNLTCIEKLCVCTCHIELVVLQLKLKQVREIYILCIYRPPSGSVAEFIMVLDETILNLSSKTNIEINLIGDININYRKRTRDVKLYKDCLRRHAMINLINLDTCHNRQGVETSAIDHFCSNNENLYSQRGICPFDISDHDIIYASLEKIKIKLKEKFENILN